jgi:hypothetical protein
MGTLLLPRVIGAGEDVESVTAADINGNGKPDSVVANARGQIVSVLVNQIATGATKLLDILELLP